MTELPREIWIYILELKNVSFKNYLRSNLENYLSDLPCCTIYAYTLNCRCMSSCVMAGNVRQYSCDSLHPGCNESHTIDDTVFCKGLVKGSHLCEEERKRRYAYLIKNFTKFDRPLNRCPEWNCSHKFCTILECRQPCFFLRACCKRNEDDEHIRGVHCDMVAHLSKKIKIV